MLKHYVKNMLTQRIHYLEIILFLVGYMENSVGIIFLTSFLCSLWLITNINHILINIKREFQFFLRHNHALCLETSFGRTQSSCSPLHHLFVQN